jgi:hypothetical protein
MMAQIEYDEAVYAPRWFAWLSVGVAMFGGLVAPAILRDPELTSGERVAAAVAVMLACALAGGAGLVFSRLSVRASTDGVRAGFGPFATTLAPDSIEGVRAEPYRWLRFGGWGLRLSWNLRDRAFSVPFVREGVTIRLQGGRTVFVSSRQPERLAAAIDGLAGHRSSASAL